MTVVGFGIEPEPRLLIVEDDLRYAAQLETAALQAASSAVVQVAYTEAEARRIAQSCTLDVASIDWELDTASSGINLLGMLRRKQSTCARIVLTHHEVVRATALEYGADEFVVKNGGGLPALLSRGARLGALRSVVECLLGLEHRELPRLDQGLSRALEQETELRSGAVLRLTKAMQEDLLECGVIQLTPAEDSLRSALRRAGWWRHPAACYYRELEWIDKVLLLLSAAGLDVADVAEILEVQFDEAKALMSRDRAVVADPIKFRRVESLFSVLGYFLQLVEYEVDALAVLVEARDFFVSSLNRTPWDQDGLKGYLIRHRFRGVVEALAWTRSH